MTPNHQTTNTPPADAPADAERQRALNIALCSAAEKGDMETVRLVLAAGALLNGVEYEGAPLAYAAEEAQLEVMLHLLAAGADATCWDDSGSSALYNAACFGSCDAVRLLLEHGASVAESLGPCDQTPIQEAASQSNIPMVQLLLDHGADINSVGDDADMTPLMTAADDLGTAEMIEFLVAHGAKLEVKDCCRGHTALMWAVTSGSWDAFHALLDAGADMYACNHRNESPMGLAAGHDDASLARCLRRHGWVAEKERACPLVEAAASGSREVADLLLEWGVPLEGRNQEGYTAFDMAVSCRRPVFARYLLERGALRSAPGRPAGVMLLLAVQEGDTEAIRAELAAGADVNARLLPALRSGLELAVEQGNAEVLRLLLAAGADTELPAYWGKTPLLTAATHKRVEMVELLLDAGAKPAFGEGWSRHHVFELAAKARCPELMRLLLERGVADQEACEFAWGRLYNSFKEGEEDAEVFRVFMEAGVNPWLHWPNAPTLFDAVRAGKLPEIARELRARGYEC